MVSVSEALVRLRKWLTTTDAFLVAAVAYGSGALGGLANFIVIMLFKVLEIDTLLHITLSPLPYHPSLLYNKLVWGGLWSFCHTIPLQRPHYLLRGLCVGLVASTIHSVIVFPAQGGGLFAQNYGKLTPILIYLSDAAWALTSSWCYHALRQHLASRLVDNRITHSADWSKQAPLLRATEDRI